MTDRPVYQTMMAAGTLDRRHEFAQLRCAATARAIPSSAFAPAG